MNAPEASKHTPIDFNAADLVTHAPMGIAVLSGEDFIVKSANASYLRMINKSEQDLVGKRLLEVMPEMEERGIGEILLGVLKTGTTFSANELAVTLTRDGRRDTGYFNVVYQPLRDAENAVTGVMAIINEVTEYVSVRQKLSDEEQRSRLAVEAAEMGTFDWDMISDAFIYSPRLAYIFGYSDHEGLLHKHFSSVIHDEDKPSRELAHREAVATGRLRYEARVVWPDKSIHWVRMLGKIVYEDSVPSKLYGIAIDITREKETLRLLEEGELRLRLATESAELGTFDIDLLTGDVHHSPRYLQVLGQPSSQGWTRSRFYECVHPDDLAIVDAGREAAFRSGTLNYEVRVIWPDQSVHWIRKNARVFFNEGSQPVRMLGTVIDITEQKNALLDAGESEQRFRAVANTAPVMIWMSGADKQCYFLNEGWLKFTGRSMEEETGEGWMKGIFPEDALRCRSVFNEAFDKREEFYIEYRLRRHDGAYRWVADKGIPRISPDGSFLGYIGSCIDIHEKTMAQDELESSVAERTSELLRRNRELQQQKEFVDTILDASIDVIAVFDKEERFISLNKKHEDAYGKKREEIIGRKMADVFPQSANLGMHLGLQKALKGEYVHEPVYKSAVTGRYTELFCVPMKDKDEVYAVLAVAHDVTGIIKSSEQLRDINTELQRKNNELAFSEERYHKMIDEVKDYAIIFIDRQGFIQNWNKGAQKIKGYSEQEILGKNFRIFYSKHDVENKVPDQLLQEAVSSGKAIGEGWRYRKDGTAFWGNVVITALYNENAEVIGFTKVTRDLTERKTAEDSMKASAEELKKKNSELERSNQELISFSYVASHDLQEPLRKINTFSEQILAKEAGRLSDTGKNYFARMQHSIIRMQTLIQDLLEYSRINTIDKKFESTDLGMLIQEVQGEFQERLEEKNATFEKDALPVLEIIPFQMKQLFSNIISNALKFSKEAEPLRIVISYATEALPDVSNPDKTSAYHRISITDNGIGFEEEYEARIFQIFQRLHGKNEYAGTGIGLAICQRVAQNHHGFMKAEGTLGKGATFHLYLPAGPGPLSK